MSHSYQLMLGVLNKLEQQISLTDQLATYQGEPAIFTHVPQNMNEYPFVTLTEVATPSYDTDSTLQFKGEFTLHSWSDQSDPAIIANIQKSIYDALHYQDLVMTGYSNGGLKQDLETILKDVDGICYTGVQRFIIDLKTNT